MKQINTNVCKWGHEMEMFYDQIWVFLSLMGIWREEIGTKTVPKLLPHSDYAKDSLRDIAVFENSILGIPTWLYSPQTVLETGCRSFCSYSGVSSLQFLRTSAGCYNLLWQISLSGAHSLTGTIFHSPPSPQLLPGLLRIHWQECVYTSDSSSLRQSGEVLSMSNLLQIHSWPVLIW